MIEILSLFGVGHTGMNSRGVFFGNVFNNFLGAIVFQDFESMETFVVVIDMKILNPGNNTTSESNNGLRYKI